MYVDGVVFGLLDTSARIPGGRLSEKLRNFTLAWSRYGYHDIILENTSLHALLRDARDQGYRYCLVQSYGHIIGETWIPKHWEQVDFQTALREWIENHEFLVTGTILGDAVGGYGLATDCLLVDLERYAALGQPEFGRPQDRPVALTIPRVMTADRGDGRLHALESSAGTQELAPRLDGWHFIETSLRNGLTVYNFNKPLDGNRLVLTDPSEQKMVAFAAYMDTGLEGYTHGADDSELSGGQRQFLDTIDSQVKDSRTGVFLFNLEAYQDVREHPEQFTPPLSSLYSVAAGFKPNMMLHSLGFAETTRMVFYDYSARALEIRKFIVSEWDGEDFPHFIRHLMKRFPPGDVFYQLWADLTPEQIDWSDVERLWLDELDKWGGPDVFRDHWSTYRKIPHEFIRCNLLTDRDALLAAVTDEPNAAIWWSNAFFTVYSNWLYTADERKRIYDGWLMQLAERNPDIFLYGSDFNNINVNHIRLREYLARYQAECSDYLKPCRLYKHEMRL